jgi:hypothetical protein
MAQSVEQCKSHLERGRVRSPEVEIFFYRIKKSSKGKPPKMHEKSLFFDFDLWNKLSILFSILDGKAVL